MNISTHFKSHDTVFILATNVLTWSLIFMKFLLCLTRQNSLAERLIKFPLVTSITAVTDAVIDPAGKNPFRASPVKPKIYMLRTFHRLLLNVEEARGECNGIKQNSDKLTHSLTSRY